METEGISFDGGNVFFKWKDLNFEDVDMIRSSIREIFSEDNVAEALNYLNSKKDSCGSDGIYLHQLKSYWENNRAALLEELETAAFVPSLIRTRDITNPKGKTRTIVLLNSIDRLILRCIVQRIQPEVEGILSDNTHAFRKDKGVSTAVRSAVDYISKGRTNVVEIDIRNYFDSISHERLVEVIDRYFEDNTLRLLITRFIHAPVERGLEVVNITQGLLQGSPLSPILSNLYLHEFDLELTTRNIPFVRYCDDINIYCKSYEEALNNYAFAKKKLENSGLAINKEKSGIYHAFNRRFLGYVFTLSDNGRVYTHKSSKSDLSVYSRWHTTSIERTDKEYHIVNDGILTKKDFTVLFENEQKKRYIPVEVTDTLNIYSNITLSSEFLSFASSHSMNVNIFNKYGDYIGQLIGASAGRSSKTLIKQAVIYADDAERLALAKVIIIAAMHNIRSNIRYYKKHKNNPVFSDTEVALSETITCLNEASSIDELLLNEARGRQLYYRAFPYIIENSEFSFHGRTKRPPQDPLNAMISFGNTVIYNRLASEINKSRLDIRIAFLHSTNNRKYSLNLDLSELFKPIIVDKVVFTIVNKHILSPRLHFEKVENGGVYLNSAGKRIFLNHLEQKLRQTIKVKDKVYTYDALMKREVEGLQRHIENKTPYHPYKYY